MPLSPASSWYRLDRTLTEVTEDTEENLCDLCGLCEKNPDPRFRNDGW